mmetsp:Transcript_96902/g.277091  ORF Transcript_96902/g.277091 Transcript_96902/m.277091 type:complete len:259 (-) Transcript_96902:1544-2320(-)
MEATGMEAGAKKTRTLLVRKVAKSKSKREILLARKPNATDDLSGPVLNLGSPSKTKGIRRDVEGRPLARSILGSVAAFEEIDALESGDIYVEEPPPPTTAAGRLTPTPASPLASSRPGSRPKSHADPAMERKKYLDHITRVAAKVDSIREEEAKRERELLELLPVNEQFGMNREAQVMARWKERQLDWERLQRNISRKHQLDPSKMMMSDSNEFREKAEEYQVIQAAIPAHERYGASYWEMSLRGQGARFVPVGNIFR